MDAGSGDARVGPPWMQVVCMDPVWMQVSSMDAGSGDARVDPVRM